MQDYFIKDSLPNEIEQLIQYQKILLNFASQKEVPIFVLEYQDEEIQMGNTTKELLIEMQKNEVYFIPKYQDNGFLKERPYSGENSFEMKHQNYELSRKLEEGQIKHLIITGINKDACVLKTAKGAKSRNYTIFTAEELMNMNKLRVEWFYNNPTHYQTLNGLLKNLL